MTSGTTTLEDSKTESTNKETVSTPIENNLKGTHFSFSLVVPWGDELPNLDQDELQDLSELEEDSDSSEDDLRPQYA
jgi:hypothetical protein